MENEPVQALIKQVNTGELRVMPVYFTVEHWNTPEGECRGGIRVICDAETGQPLLPGWVYLGMAGDDHA
jgi:hypothetical protein